MFSFISFPLVLISLHTIYVHAFTSFNYGAKLAKSRVLSLEAANDLVELIDGQKVSKLGIGTWAWGDSLFWGYNNSQDSMLQEAFNASISLGVNLFDTAEIYGIGKSELLLGRFRRQYSDESSKDNILFASKFAALPWRIGSKEVVSACRDSLDRMGISQMPLYQKCLEFIYQTKLCFETTNE